MRDIVYFVAAVVLLQLLLPPQVSAQTSVTQFSMNIANADRSFGNVVAMTISFVPSNPIPVTGNGGFGRISLFFPVGMFPQLACPTLRNCPKLTYETSVGSAILSSYFSQSPCSGNVCHHAINNDFQSVSIPANVLFTVTISGVALGAPQDNIANSVYVTTTADSASSNAVDSGIIGLGSYIDGSCPYGMTWSNAMRACTSCSAVVNDQVSAASFICKDFKECMSCTSCPVGQAVNTASNLNSIIGPPAIFMYYGCSDSSSKCPAGSGKQGDKGGCIPCPFDMYNDGSSATCQYCPSDTYPSYSTMKAPVLVACTAPAGENADFGSFGCSAFGKPSVQTGYVMKKSASSCSSKCPAGTGVLSDTKRDVGAGTLHSWSISDSLRSLTVKLKFLWGTSISSGIIGDNIIMTSKSGKGCAPCSNWFISKDNTCQACNQGANDRAALNSLGDTFMFATRCVFDICPWPYVPADMYKLNHVFADVNSLPLDSRGVCTAIHLGGSTATITVIAIILLGTYIASICVALAVSQDEAMTIIRRRKLVLGMIMTTASPAVDFVSDIMYIVSTLFYDVGILVVACLFFMLPMYFFWRMLNKHGVHFSFYIGSPPAFAVMEKYDSIPKALLGLVGYLPLYVINLPVMLPLFLLGHVLYCCKIFPISRVSNLWLRLYTRSTKHTNNVVIIIPLLQESIFEEMLTESVPQMVIQIVNNSITHVWTPLSYFSTAMSSIMILNGIWRLAYYRLYLKIGVDAIPTDLSDEIFHFSSIEVGAHPIGSVSGVKSDALMELKTVSSHSSETEPTEGISEELSPLIQRHISASIAELKAEMADQKVEILSQLRSEAIALEQRLTEKLNANST